MKLDQLQRFLTSQYDLLLSEFKSDRSSKVESHDLTEEKLKEKEELRIKFEKDQEKNKNRIITSKSSIHKFKKIGEIDLDKKTPNQDIEIKNDVKILNLKEDNNEKVQKKMNLKFILNMKNFQVLKKQVKK